MTRCWRRTCAVLLPLLILATPAAAQVSGFQLQLTLTSNDGTLLADAFVQLRSRSGEVLHNRFSDGAGLVSFEIVEPGRFRVLVRQLGRADWDSPELDLRAGRDTALVFEIPVQPVALEEIAVSSRGRCRAPKDGRELVRRYDLMKSSLGEVQRIEDSGLIYIGQMIRDIFGRRLYSSNPRRLIWPDTSRIRSARPLASPSPDSVVMFGFAHRGGDDEIRTYAPTPMVLTSEAFLLSHCFGVVDDVGASRIGLTFRPLDGVQHVDVEGTVWMDSANGEVVEVEFAFTGIMDFLGPDVSRVMLDARTRYPSTRLRFNGITPFALADMRGRIEFMRLDDGRPVLKRWEIASPYLDYTTISEAGRGIDVFGQIRPLVTSLEVLAILPPERDVRQPE